MPAAGCRRSVMAVGGSLFPRVTGFPRPHSKSKKNLKCFFTSNSRRCRSLRHGTESHGRLREKVSLAIVSRLATICDLRATIVRRQAFPPDRGRASLAQAWMSLVGDCAPEGVH